MNNKNVARLIEQELSNGQMMYIILKNDEIFTIQQDKKYAEQIVNDLNEGLIGL